MSLFLGIVWYTRGWAPWCRKPASPFLSLPPLTTENLFFNAWRRSPPFTQSPEWCSSLCMFPPHFNNRSWFSLHPSDDLGSVSWHSPAQDQNLFTVWDVLTQGGSSFPEETQDDLWALEMSLLLYTVKPLTQDSPTLPRAYGGWCWWGFYVFKAAFMSLQTALVVENSLAISPMRSSPDMIT